MRKRDISINKTSSNRACLTHNLSIANGPHGAHFSFGDPRNFGNKLNATQRLCFMNRNFRFDKFIKSVISWMRTDISVYIQNCVL